MILIFLCQYLGLTGVVGQLGLVALHLVAAANKWDKRSSRHLFLASATQLRRRRAAGSESAFSAIVVTEEIDGWEEKELRTGSGEALQVQRETVAASETFSTQLGEEDSSLASSTKQ